jgi:hypothetical protein
MATRRALRVALTALEIALLGACWTSCSSTSNGAAADAGDEGDATLDGAVQEDSGCDPCATVCPCTFGDTFFNTGKCETVTCGPSGRWGGSCLGLGCMEAGDDGPCDPCTQVCSCTAGTTRFDYAACRNVTCSPSGAWGPGAFCPGNACVDAAIDAANESGADVIPDVVNEAATD